MEINDTLTSGFIGEGIEKDSYSFQQIKPIYVSDSGYTCLYEAYRHGKKHILKTLKSEYRGEWLYEQALRKEFAIGYQLEHPHIERTLGWEEVAGLGACIILEYIDGVTLKEWMKSAALDKESVQKVLGELGEALQYLHNKQIVHRDIKPENVMITYNGANVKLIDFSLSDCDDSTILKIPAGTRRYLAPECLTPGYVPNMFADIYALGVIISELAVSLNDGHLAKVSRRCMRRLPAQRYKSATLVCKAIQNRKSWTREAWIGGSSLLAACLITGLWLFQPDSFSSPQALPVYGNFIEEEGLRRNIWSMSVAMPDEKDTSAIHRKIQETLHRTYPLPAMRQTPAYKTLLEGCQRGVY